MPRWGLPHTSLPSIAVPPSAYAPPRPSPHDSLAPPGRLLSAPLSLALCMPSLASRARSAPYTKLPPSCRLHSTSRRLSLSPPHSSARATGSCILRPFPLLVSRCRRLSGDGDQVPPLLLRCWRRSGEFPSPSSFSPLWRRSSSERDPLRFPLSPCLGRSGARTTLPRSHCCRPRRSCVQSSVPSRQRSRPPELVRPRRFPLPGPRRHLPHQRPQPAAPGPPRPLPRPAPRSLPVLRSPVRPPCDHHRACLFLVPGEIPQGLANGRGRHGAVLAPPESGTFLRRGGFLFHRRSRALFFAATRLYRRLQHVPHCLLPRPSILPPDGPLRGEFPQRGRLAGAAITPMIALVRVTAHVAAVPPRDS
ncbi:unnamed protein product [Closterium sp. NIES-54]